MNHFSSTNSDTLNRGIAAARAKRQVEAYRDLTSVLKQDPHNIPALLWLAFVAPDPRDSIRLLERVLALDPTNARAKAGLQWAAERLRAASNPKKAAKKAAAAGRRRRTRLLLGTITVALLAVLGLLAWRAVGVLGNPTALVAGWGPDAVASVASVVAVEPELVLTQTIPPNFASEMDTIIMQLPELAGVAAVEPSEASPSVETGLPQMQPVAEAAASILAASESVVAVAPSALIGPELALAATRPEENLLLAHQPAYPGQKWIEVNVSTQQITAWEGDQPVFTFIGSTGLPDTPTVLGEFNIYWKLESTLMTGPGYYLPEVPYTMYFFRGYALHGAYWHSNFGQPMSHGCVNLETGDAQKLFEWADPVIPPGYTQVVASADNPGTLVVVHD